jgi:FKBP-type peptidyl-prolyl cis-trans isomerase FkpA
MIMKKYFLLLGLLVVTLTSCLKLSNQETTQPTPVDPVIQAKADSLAITAYLAANPSITAKRDSASGLYYQIITPGTGTNPTANSVITVAYTGKLLNGTQFDSQASYTQALSGLIPGWIIGIPFIKTGGRILLIVPSALGYGNQLIGQIPANSVLVFTVDLISFN